MRGIPMRPLVPALLVALVLGVHLPVAAQETAPRLPPVELPAELNRVLRDYESAWSAGDEDALAALFTEQGHVSGPDGWIRGREAIRARYAGADGDLRLRAVAYATHGDVAWIVGAYGYAIDFDTRDSGRFILALERGDDGRWMIVADLDSANRRRD